MSEKPEIDKNKEELESLLHEGGAEKPPAADPDSGEDKHCFPYYDFMRSVFRRFDKSFVWILIIENFNFGLWVLVTLCQQDLFKAYLNQEPGDMALYNSLITLPWSLKVIYGLISDNVRLCGLKRKPYLIFFALVQFATMLTIFLLETDDALVIVMLLLTASLSMAFSNVVVDAILVVQARRDGDLGSQDLLSIAWLFQGLGGVLGAVAAAFIMEDIHPKWAFLAYGCFGLLVGIACCFLSREAEVELLEGEEEYVSHFSSEYTEGQLPAEAIAQRQAHQATIPKRGEEGCCYMFKKNMKQIWWALQRWEIYCLVIYFILDGITNPSFADFSYFFLLNVVGVSKFMFAMIALIGQVCSVIGVLIYENFLKEVEVRTVIMWNVILGVLGAWLNYMFAMRWNLDMGINDYAFIIFSDVVFGAISTSFGTLPILALFAKITPKRIEGTMFAFLTGTSNLDQGVIAPAMGSWINYQFVGVTKDDQSGYSTLALISFFCSFFGFALLPLIPKKAAIEESQKERAEQEIQARKESNKRREERWKLRNKNARDKGEEEKPFVNPDDE